MLTALSTAAMLLWLMVLVQPWQPWRMRECFAAPGLDRQPDLADVTVLVPARDEADTLAATLTALGQQGDHLKTIVIDDHSTDATPDIARSHGVTLLSAPELADGWTGKLWALEQGRLQATTDYLLLLDADIRIDPGTIAGLRNIAVDDRRDLVSLMARLRMTRDIERLLIPAFIYFFKLLYPFALSNNGSRWVAASAGGCVLIRRDRLEAIGGFASLADAIIDDCTLARHVRAAGGRTWVGVTQNAVSLRGYDDFAEIHAMVARSAFTQLRYSTALLVVATALMVVMFWMPLIGLLVPGVWASLSAVIAFVAMAISYLPTLRYYRLGASWACAMPVIATLYLFMTWSSAIRYWRGTRSAWRGRNYSRR